ncbi:class E sortase [Blastococcus goldschmidtiae]|uniref:Class E sortase n=1 Tax=Blastococcus goldschmidtiae TaxID=3075546 RepID=A0ABU2KAX5_9ACTN|nr:class E sortase [Blastococcus sp. DSM 46792]MDT0277308.1 class E sortase [Blastococcus sp. DSM 46792]
MADPDGDRRGDRTERWDRVPELGGPPLRGRPPVPARVGLVDAPPPVDDPAEDDVDQDNAAPRRRDPLWRTAARGVGELLVTAGMVLLLFVVYEVYVTDLLTAQRQDELSEDLREQWASESPAARRALTQVEIGDAFGVLRIPRLGEDYTRVVLEGTEEEQLSQGPGHYVDSAMPGEEGNLALAGHRVGKGSPFLELDTMRPGDPIVVETADSWFVYRVLGDPATGDVDADPSGIPGMHVVSPAAVEVVSPTPNAAAGAAPSGAYLTLTTCHPRYSARQRLIIHARLDGGALSKTQYPDGPDALYER